MGFGSGAAHWFARTQARGAAEAGLGAGWAGAAEPVARAQSDAAGSRPGSGFRPYRNLFKRWIDVALVILSLPVVLPLIALMAGAVARDGHSPFFRQERVGRDGRLFTIWKLRTMVPDAERILEAHLAACPESLREWQANQKLRNDPRITPVGGLLRKISFDELPQLWNVLKGDMSLVGPRPMMPSQRALYPGTAYFRLRPGITGFWQISKRNESTFAARAQYDAAYLRAVSLKTDVKVLISTVGVVMRGTGL